MNTKNEAISDININLTNLNKSITMVYKNLSNYKEKIDDLLLNFKSFDKCWNDINSGDFKIFVEKDEELFTEYIGAIENYVKFIQDFSSSLNNLFVNINEDESLLSLKYVNEYVKDSITYLDKVTKGINNAFKIYNTINIPSNTSTYYDISGLMNNISNNIIDTVKSQILGMKKKLIDLLTNLNEEINNIDFIEIDDNICTIEKKHE